jgi:subtilisin family serine protease
VRRAALAAVLLALAVPGAADAGRYAVGARSLAELPALQRALGGGESLAPVPAVIVEAAAPPRVPEAAWVERLDRRRLALAPGDPLAAKQWHLTSNRAYDAWEALPPLAAVRVAVLDSGIDAEHPEFEGKIAGSASFVGGSARADAAGHGTFVAGLIAAGVDNGIGIAGMAPSAELLVAKVVDSDGTIPVEAEVKAIRWAVANGARVINMSLGGVRDPRDPSRDTYSPLEASALAYAHRRGVVVVAAVGNSDQAPSVPWRYASYPAALPHVLGVSALARDGSSPVFSNRDPIYNDIAAPGQEIVSTLPRHMTGEFPACVEQGYSTCGPEDYRTAEGTSFAAPQVSAAAAMLLALRPRLRPEQVTYLLTRSAADVNAGTGCRSCPLLRDGFTGWGRLDVTAAVRALDGELPAHDVLEPNDEAGTMAPKLWGQTRRLTATLDYWDDQSDVYRMKLRKGQVVYVSVRGPAGTDTNLILWKPATKRVYDFRSLALRAKQSARPGPRENLGYRAPAAGWYFVQVKLASRGAGTYRLTIVKA